MRSRTKGVLGGGLLVLLTALLVGAYWRFIWSAPTESWEWVRNGVTYRWLEPRTLGVLLVAPVLILILVRSLADLPWQQRVLALTFRLLFLALVALALGRWVRTAETRKICTVVLVDASDSVTSEALEDARNLLNRVLQGRGKEDLVKLVTFARYPRLVALPEQGQPPIVPPATELRPAAQSGAPLQSQPGAATDVGAALRLAYGLYPPGYLKRALLVSDGVETEGDLLAEASRARNFGIKVSVVPYRRPVPGELAVRDLRLPDKVAIGETFEIRADVYSTRSSRARVRLYQEDMLNGLDGVREIELEPGENSVAFKSVVRVGGETTYSLKLEPLGADKFRENNQYSVTVDVPSRPAVLYVEGQPQSGSYLARALIAQQFDVDLRAPSSFPGSLKELERFDFVLLSDVPKEAVGATAQVLIEKYVRDLGGGFLFAGGETGYGLGGWAHSTIERILPVRMDAERRKDQPTVAMALVIDRSGSMTGLPIEMAKAACKATVGTLQGDDLLEVIAFDSQAVRYVKMQPARYSARIQNEILRIEPGGGTEIFPALDMAYQDISVVRARKKHVILLTDGQSPTQGLRDLVQAMVAEAITVTTVGLGDEADADLLRSIADLGGGRYHHVPDPNSLPRIFTRETELIARQAAVEEWFPVEQVSPAGFLDGIAIGTAPLLHGYVATQMKRPPAQLILASDRGEPILARWRVGLGHTLAWTSDVKNQWAVDWIRWPAWGKFWGQLVREHMRRKHHRELDMKTEVIGGRVRAVVDAFTLDERFRNDMRSMLTVTGPEPGGGRRQVPMRQIAPGRYEAEFTPDRFGSFLLRAEHRQKTAEGEERHVGESYGHVTLPYPREYASFEPDLERLVRTAITTGGQLDPAPRSLFEPGEEKISYHEELWSRFILAALAAFLLDLLVRRVRLFDRKFLPRRSRASGVPGGGRDRSWHPPPP
ncbi:VWA domain-containing protein [Myxococcota bacterium]